MATPRLKSAPAELFAWPRQRLQWSYPPAIRRQLLSKHFLISTVPEGALDNLVKFTTVARFEPHRVIFSKGDKGRLSLRHPVGPRTDLLRFLGSLLTLRWREPDSNSRTALSTSGKRRRGSPNTYMR
jgi:hypothetical protein